MFSENEFKARFIEELARSGKLDVISNMEIAAEFAEDNWQVYKDNPDGTPEEWAQDEVREWE